MTRFSLIYTRRAADDIEKLDGVVRRRLGKKLLEFATDPMNFSKKIHDSALGGWRFRVGDYRVIFDLDGDQIIVLRVGHRKDIHR